MKKHNPNWPEIPDHQNTEFIIQDINSWRFWIWKNKSVA